MTAHVHANGHAHDGDPHDHAAHDVGHHHTHGGLGHSHAPATFDRAFVVGFVLNTGFVVAEVVYGLRAHSLALVSDAGHNLSDVLGLVLAWIGMRLSQTRPTDRRTFGHRRASILAALANAATLLFVIGAVTWEAVRRFANPEPVAATTIIVIAAIGIVINGVTAMMFFRGRAHDVNIRGAYLHMASDALVSVGVVVAGIAIRVTGKLWIDPVISIAIGLIVAVGTWGLLRESMNLAMDAVPEHIDPAAVREYLERLPGVRAVHDLHIWGMSTTETAMTAHLVTPDESFGDARLLSVAADMRTRFRIGHTTIQLERGDGSAECEQEPGHVV